MTLIVKDVNGLEINLVDLIKQCVREVLAEQARDIEARREAIAQVS